MVASAIPQLSATVGTTGECSERYAGRMLGMSAASAVDALHFLSAGAVGFARGLNDTPKIAALLVVAGGLQISWGIAAVAVAMALGGLLQSARVAHTMSRKLTGMNPGQGCSANLATAVLVSTASWTGLPVSTTHVSVGALVGQGMVTRRVHWKPVGQVALSWVITLPCSAAIAALVAWMVRLG
jgi:PiT family inorganic phosphate transporter